MTASFGSACTISTPPRVKPAAQVHHRDQRVVGIVVIDEHLDAPARSERRRDDRTRDRVSEGGMSEHGLAMRTPRNAPTPRMDSRTQRRFDMRSPQSRDHAARLVKIVGFRPTLRPDTSVSNVSYRR
jgi:hypothetical protein